MAYHNTTAVGVAVQLPHIVSQLRTVFDNLEDAPLIETFVGPTRRGPKGHPVKALWRSFVMKHALGLPSTVAMIRMLRDNPYVAQVCGFTESDAIPHEATFSRFFARLAKQNYLHLVKNVSRRMVRRHYATLPGFGKRVAIDSTTLKGWSNGGKKRKADKDAGWSVKNNTHGKTEFTFGYKLHLLVDCEHELPIGAVVTPGNGHDGATASRVLSESRFTYGRFHPKFIIADKGYAGRPLMRLIRGQYVSTPIIDLPSRYKRLMAETAKSFKTPEWKAIYAQRPAVERVFSRLKGQRSLNRITTRRIWKVTVHCYLALIAMQAMAVVRQCDSPIQPLMSRLKLLRLVNLLASVKSVAPRQPGGSRLCFLLLI